MLTFTALLQKGTGHCTTAILHALCIKINPEVLTLTHLFQRSVSAKFLAFRFAKILLCRHLTT
ncbi:unnamed protein product [Amoebophrya sp. A120]|nr:unnamed protein product [Amoebophrya sp. A120]|eukprot:GSA120T00014028001.1